MIATTYTLAREPWVEIVGRVGLEQTCDNSLSVGRIDDPNIICHDRSTLNIYSIAAQTTHLTQTARNVCNSSILVRTPLADEEVGLVVHRSARSDPMLCLGVSGLHHTNCAGAWGPQRALSTRTS